MRNRRRWQRVLVLGGALVVAAIALVWLYLIPALLVAEMRKHYDGYIAIRGWWIGLSSSGVTGLTLRESPAASSPVWATAERVTTGLSLAEILHGRVTPARITIVKPRILCRISEDGSLVTGMPLKHSNTGPTPALSAEQGRLTLAQDGRPEMVVKNINGRFDPDPNALRFSIRSRDARWGNPVVEGHFGPEFNSVELRLTADPLPADREKAARIPFIAESVWRHFEPTGPVRLEVDYKRSQGWSGPARIKTVVDFEQARIVLPGLRLTANEAVGRMTYQDHVVWLDGMRGAMASGRVTVSGTMNFQNQVSRYALAVGVDATDLRSLPASWGLEMLGVAGRLTGSARLRMELTNHGLDVTGSTGQGAVEEASIRDIPLGQLELRLRGEGRRADVAEADYGVFTPQWIGSDVTARALDLDRVFARAGTNHEANEIPVSGRLDVRMKLRMPLGRLHEADGDSIRDLHEWSGSGLAEGSEIEIRSVRFRDVSAALTLQSGRLAVSDLAAKLAGQPLTGGGAVDLTPPHAFSARLDGSGLPLADLWAQASSSRGQVKVSGTVAGQALASGTLTPWRLESHGHATIDDAKADRVSIGDVPIDWETRGENVVVTTRDLERYGGRVSALTTIPIGGDRAVEGTVTLSRVDTASLSAEIPFSLRLTGLADGQARFRIPPTADHSPPLLQAKLTATEMTIEGIPATTVRATVAVHDGVPKFEAHADGLNGSFVVRGTGRLDQDSQPLALDAEVKATGFQLASLCAALGEASEPVANVRGLGTIAARVQMRGPANSLHANGSIDVRDLKWGETYELGQVSAGFAIDPSGWRVDNLEGALWESPIHGEFWRRDNGDDPPRYGLDLRLEGASLARIFAFDPKLERRFEGQASFIAQGTSRGSLKGRGEFRVTHGQVHRLPIMGLSIPIEWDVRPEKKFLGTVRIRHAWANVAGGRLYGDATVSLGPQHHVHADLAFEHIDLRTISRTDNSSARQTPGVIDGVVSLDSPSISFPQDYTGAIDLELTGAALVDIPILDRLDRAIGAAQGAVFEDGDLHGHIARRAIHVDRLTLVGPLAQLHATGTVSFDGRLNLRAFVNTNDVIAVNPRLALVQFATATGDIRANEQTIERMADFFSSRLMKVRIEGTLRHPTYKIDQSIPVDRMVIDFFIDALRLASSGARR